MTDEIKRTNLVMPLDVFRKARGKAITEGSNLSTVVVALLQMWLAGEIELSEPEKPLERRAKKKKT